MFSYCSGLGFASSTIELVLPSLLLPKLISEWNLSATIGSTLMIGTFAGEVIGGLIWARISDRIGRRAAYVGTATLVAICASMSAGCTNFTQLLLTRFGLGVALGGSMAIDFVYFLEFVPTAFRGSRAALIILVGIFGLFLVGFLGHFVMPQYGWRVFLFACAVPSIILAFGRWLWPWESPRFLYNKGRITEAEIVINEMHRWNKASKHGHITLIPAHKVENHAAPSLKEYRHLLPLIVTFGLVFTLHTFSYYGMTTWFGKFGAAYKLSSVAQSTGLMIIAVAEVPGLFLSCKLIDRLGRRSVLAGNLMGAALAVSLMTFIPKDSPNIFLLTSCLAYFFIVGVWSGLYVYGPEVFPTAIRSTAFAICGTMGKLGVW